MYTDTSTLTAYTSTFQPRRILLLYASKKEIKHIKKYNTFQIGIKAEKLNNVPLDYDLYILIGACGSLVPDWKQHNILIDSFGLFYCSEKPVHDKEEADRVRKTGRYCVDMESAYVRTWGRRNNKVVGILKYVTDYCDEKVKPKGINHFWLIWQHFRMQRRIEKRLGALL